MKKISADTQIIQTIQNELIVPMEHYTTQYANVGNVVSVYDPEYGNLSYNSAYFARGMSAGVPNGYVIHSVTARIRESTAPGTHIVRAAVWGRDWDGFPLIDQSADVNNIGTAFSEVVFTGFAGMPFLSGYYVGLAINNGGNNIIVAGKYDSNLSRVRYTATSENLPPNSVLSSPPFTIISSQDWDIYITLRNPLTPVIE